MRTLPASIILAHPEKCGFNAKTASCGHMMNALMTVTNGCLNFQSDGIGILYLE
jgi:hypothetical protein